MTHGGIHQLGGGSGPPLEPLAAQTLAAMRGQPRYQPPPLTEADRAEAEAAAKENERICRYCIGLHPAPNTVGCPRIASGKLDGDGKLTEFTYWPGTEWAKGRVTFVEDAFEEDASDDIVE